jgi:hypothetical protein
MPTGWEVADAAVPTIGARAAATTAPLVPTTDNTFDFQDVGSNDSAWLRFQVTIRRGGSPAGVALAKLSPLFSVGGKDAISYVSDAFFRDNPNRRTNTIQPGDTFTLWLPANTFVVRSEEVRDDPLAQPARVEEYTSEYGDQLRYYLMDPFPIRFEIAGASASTRWTIHLNPELSALARAGRTDANRLARLLYRVPDPDILQIESARHLLDDGAPRTIVVDRSQSHLDAARQFDDLAIRTERVTDSDREHLVRRVFAPDQGVPFMAVEDAITANDTREGIVVRVEYHWDGVVRVVYRTGPADTKGKRNPYQLRENERWAALYQAYGGDDPATQPVKWGEGEPADFPPFPTARDPWQRSNSYDFLVPGRYLVLTFQPTRSSEQQKSDARVKGTLDSIRDRYHDEINSALDFVDALRPRDARSQ